ncbi:unnamed protein product [Caenorhabditis angaria]|uniref:Arrestin C-terminal-like domain-containing protein n=1 Tax=Caenorhabditis angaria TaxID=860376 RepID=A0A9P1ICV1_9PELO|nr:unnamed protein product [Caenorhabditis angaria]
MYQEFPNNYLAVSKICNLRTSLLISVNSHDFLSELSSRFRAKMTNVLAKIKFSKSSYYPGEKVEGFVEFNFDKDENLKVNSIEVTMNGEAHAHWQEGLLNHSAIINYTKHFIKVLADSKNSGKIVANFDFCFKLPDRVPPSFEGEFCDIRYFIHVKIEGGYGDLATLEKSFTVLPISNPQPNNLKNPIIHMKTSLKQPDSGIFGWFQNDILELSGYIVKREYLSGEYVALKLVLKNYSSQFPIESLKIDMIQRIRAIAKKNVEFFYYTGESDNNQIIEKISENILKCHVESEISLSPRTETNLRIDMKVPNSVAPTITQEMCTIIQVEYFLRVTVDVSNVFGEEIGARTIHVDAPMVIGGIEIEKEVDGEEPPSYEQILNQNMEKLE